MNRSICIICKRKLIRSKMIQHGQHWTCASCVIGSTEINKSRIRVLNLYAGIGGNRFLWPGNLDITAVEMNPKIAAEYKINFPGDTIIIADAHNYLLHNYMNYDIIWSSPPCQTHTRMNYILEKKRYIDLGLYQEIILLKNFFSGKYVIENVSPYYNPLIGAEFKLCRHLFWTNVKHLNDVILPEFEAQFRGARKGINVMDRKSICRWLGIPDGSKTIYLSGKSSEQVYRNCVHPKLGLSIMNDILKSMTGK